VTHSRKAVEFHGLIQHSFALRIQGDRRPYHGMDPSKALIELFKLPATGGAEFQVHSVNQFLKHEPPNPSRKPFDLPSYSPLVKNRLTTLVPQEIPFLQPDAAGALPKPLRWAEAEKDKEKDKEKEKEKEKDERWERFIFAQDGQGDEDSPRFNDFLVETTQPHACECEAHAVSRVLCQLLAHRRSMLFGLSLAGRFFNVMLPHAFLKAENRTPPRDWILQPLVSLIQAGGDGSGFQRTFSLTFFLIPVSADCADRKMSVEEIKSAFQAEWNLASSRSPKELASFSVSGPLLGYISRLDPSVLPSLLPPANGHRPLRQTAEAILFAVALRIAQGSEDRADKQLRQRIGDDVVTSLSNSRVSSLLAVDPKLTEKASKRTDKGPLFPGSLKQLMRATAGEDRIAQRKRYRIDRPFYDPGDCAIAVLPTNRCIICTTAGYQQRGSYTSGLMQAGWLAYMAIGASVAISTMRSIYRDLERVELSEPSAIARIEREVAVDLDEIYDLDITWEAYRHRYRLLRDRLGITSDYEALHGKLQAFYRETEARFEAKTQRRLMVLTAAIVVLSLLILAGTIVLGVK
jgi:hypothetical protein